MTAASAFLFAAVIVGFLLSPLIGGILGIIALVCALLGR